MEGLIQHNPMAKDRKSCWDQIANFGWNTSSSRNQLFDFGQIIYSLQTLLFFVIEYAQSS
jgi:hypothetical protein